MRSGDSWGRGRLSHWAATIALLRWSLTSLTTSPGTLESLTAGQELDPDTILLLFF